MTWLVIVGLALGLGAMLLRARWRERGEVVGVGVTLAAGLLGYALTGHPGLPESPARRIGDDRGFVGAYDAGRRDLLVQMGEEAAWLTYAEALTRSGNPAAAIRGLERGLTDHPRSADLWIGLGQALTEHGGRVGPAARLAFARAAVMAPGRPEAAYFLGLAHLETGDPAAAVEAWAAIREPLPRLAADRARACAMLAMGLACGGTTPSTSPGG